MIQPATSYLSALNIVSITIITTTIITKHFIPHLRASFIGSGLEYPLEPTPDHAVTTDTIIVVPRVTIDALAAFTVQLPGGFPDLLFIVSHFPRIAFWANC